jgi:hypothetical protein
MKVSEFNKIIQDSKRKEEDMMEEIDQYKTSLNRLEEKVYLQ